MKVIRIFGAPYSSTTVLGFIINTAPGFLFGSEIYRLLPAYTKRLNKPAICHFCGNMCNVWSPQLIKEIVSQNIKYVDETYAIFGKHNEQVQCLVDSSKAIDRYSGEAGNYIDLVASKHPIRLLSSHFYHRRKDFFGAEDAIDFEVFRKKLDECSDLVAKVANTVSREQYLRYEAIFTKLQSFTLLKNDNLHQANFARLRELEVFLGVKSESFDPINFSKYEAHTIGGNRMPSNQRSKYIGAKNQIHNPRIQYYETAESLGDFKIDDKYRIIFSPKTLSIVQKSTWYRRLCEQLSYNPWPN